MECVMIIVYLWLWILWNADTDQVSLKFSLSIPSALQTAVTRTILKQIQLFDFRSMSWFKLE